ncbi:MAG: TetR/AcrR family transcriptional regulator [Rhizobiaceae bacterium]|nr:TetR/AcrR family transcriptional regulator [Rhizobiaceae bacterium]
MKRKKPLAGEDWIKAAFRALSSAGPQAIRVESIARDLKVSKGSFYWHFKDVAALKSAMLDHWARVGTADIIARSGAGDASPKEQLEIVIELATGNGTDEYGGLLSEGAIRNWARSDKQAALVLAKVEKARLQFVEENFAKLGFSAANSAIKARILYAGLIGIEHLSLQGFAEMRNDMLNLLELLLSEPDAGTNN